MKVERNRTWNKYTFTPEDKEDEKFLDRVNGRIEQLEAENKSLKEVIEKLHKEIEEQDKEYCKLKEKLWQLEWEKLWADLLIDELKEENKRLRKWIDIRLDSMWVKYIIIEEWDYFAKSDFKITE